MGKSLGLLALAGSLLIRPGLAYPDEPPRGAKASGTPKPEGLAAVGWTPELFVRVNAVGSVRVSPDGRRVVFAVSEALVYARRSRYRTHIHIADSGGKDSSTLTSGEASCYNPQWSPDGRWVSFLSARSGKTNLWLVPAAGG